MWRCDVPWRLGGGGEGGAQISFNNIVLGKTRDHFKRNTCDRRGNTLVPFQNEYNSCILPYKIQLNPNHHQL